MFSGTQVNFDKSMQPYKTWQYGQSSTDLFRLIHFLYMTIIPTNVTIADKRFQIDNSKQAF